MIIMKFGGTSVSSVKNITNIIAIAKSEKDRSPVIVVSALSGITDMLLSLFDGNNQTKILNNIKQCHFTLAKDIWGKNIPAELLEYLEKILKKLILCFR